MRMSIGLLHAAVLALVLCSFQVHAELEYEVVPDVVYGHKAGMALTFDVIKPKQNNLGIGLLYVFSSGYNSVWISPDELIAKSAKQGGRFATVLEGGFTLFMVRHGSNPYFTVPEIVADIRRATRFVRLHAEDYGIDPDRIGVFGNSAGGHLSLMIGTASDNGNPKAEDPVDRVSDRVAAVVVYYPPVDFRGRAGKDAASPVLQFDADLEEAMSPLLHVTADDPPTLLIHGDEDPLVPLEQSAQIHTAFEKVGVPTEFIVMKGAGHSFKGQHGKDAARALTDWFDKYLRTEK